MDFYTVIKCIDSSCLNEDIKKILDFHRVSYDEMNNNVCLTIENLHQALRSKVFTDFDEVWLFTDSFPAQCLESLSKSTSDAENFAEQVPQNVLDTFQKSGCKILLADGCGLNYLTDELPLEELLKKSNQIQ